MGAVNLPALTELLDGARVVSVPLRTRFRGVDHREAVLLRGPAGWGEFAPFLEYGDAESARWLAAAVESAWMPPPLPLRNRVPVNATVPAVAAVDVATVLARFPGCTTAKVKVAEPGQTLADDVARVGAARQVLGDAGLLRVDANGAWSVADAVDALRSLEPFGLEYAEQPCAGIGELRDLRLALHRSGVEVLVAADESVRKAADPRRVAVAGAADVVVLKVAPLGGVWAAIEVARSLGEEHGLPVVVSSALETSVGIAAGVALAAALPGLPFACGLGTASLLADDVVAEPLVPRDGFLPVRESFPDDAALDRLAAPPHRRAWWLARMSRCHRVLAGGRRPVSHR
jgi:O-succinylbenzoate synthase